MSLDPQALNALFEMSRDAVLGIENEIILFLNPAAEALFGAVPGEQAAEYIPDYILSDPAESFIASIRTKSRGGHAAVTRSGNFSLICLTFPPDSSQPSPLLNRSIQELSSSLMSSRLALDVITRKTHAEEDAGLRGYTASLYRDYYRMKRLCEHILTADAIEKQTLRFQPEVIFLDRLCRELCETVQHFTSSLNVILECNIENADYSTMADETLLENMILNLLSNSVSHANPGAHIRLNLSRQNRRLILAVDDQGCGIPPESMHPLMDGHAPLRTTDAAAGAGLGLIISRGIAEVHGGALIFESCPGVGTKLRVSLPIIPPPSDILRSPRAAYQNSGMDRVLTELSVILDKKFYNKTLFD